MSLCVGASGAQQAEALLKTTGTCPEHRFVGTLVRPIEKCFSANAGTISDITSITHSFGVEVINAHPSASADLVLGHGARGAAMDDVKGGLLETV